MKQTLNGLSSNAAIRKAKATGEMYFVRSNANRWYVMRGDECLFGRGLHPATLDACKWFVAGMTGNVTVTM